MNTLSRFWALSSAVVVSLVAGANAAPPPATAAPAETVTAWHSMITVQEVQSALADPSVVLLDAREPVAYAQGHLPGAINLPGSSLRTPSARPADSPQAQDIFEAPDGTPDVARYEQLLSAAGISRDLRVIVYGNHAGTADGSVAALIFHWLGHEKVQFVDGIGVEQWTRAGYALSTEPVRRKPAVYTANPIGKFVWHLPDVLAHLEDPSVVFYDTRSQKEYTGEDKRGNARGGHIPGAVWLDYAALLRKDDKTTLPPAEVRARLTAAGITPEKKVVLYCQTATRVSLPLLALKDLGYRDVVVYDASWQEYGNRADTPVVAGPNAR